MILLCHGEIKGPVSYSIFCYFLMNSNSVTFYRLIIPDGSLPTTEHPTVLSVIQSENHTVLNVLVDQVLHYVISNNYSVCFRKVVHLPYAKYQEAQNLSIII